MVEVSAVAGVVAGRNPLEYSLSSPYTLFIFQSVVIISICTIIHYPLRLLLQPKVIAEVITGILLGPTVMGRIPNFTATCFPTELIPGLTLMANIGIIFFLFMVGLEVDLTFIKKHIRAAITVGLVNMAVPFGLGCAISVGIYKEYRENAPDMLPISFTTYMVFIAVAMCVTAFPVLARILTELNLITDRVGTIVLAAGITNDLVGWILLALVVILANASKPVNTVYILLLTLAWFLFMFYPVRYCLKYYLRRFTNDLVTGEPSQFLVMLILAMTFISAFYTDIIGVHAIFGAFMVGIIVPRDNGYVIRLTEKLEDLVHVVMIPIYFALAGLNVNLGLLNTGTDWGYIIAIISLAMFGKIFGGFIAAKFNKMLWRESVSVGVLMSCKGIVEIVVLNIGMSAGILSQKVYSMFIVMALVTTFLTTPLTLWVYPVWYREKVKNYLAGNIKWDGTPLKKDEHEDLPKSFHDIVIKDVPDVHIPRSMVLLKNIDCLASLMLFLQLYFKGLKDTEIKALHVREFSSRTSHLLEASTKYEEDTEHSTSVLDLFKIFSRLMDFKGILKSIFATPKNQLLAINDQVASPNDFIFACDKNVSVLYQQVEESETSNASLYKKLFTSSKCNFGLLLTSRRPETDSDSIVDLLDMASSVENGSFAINVVISNDNSLTPSDLLALHTAYQLASLSKRVNVFIKSSSQSVGLDDEIESMFKNVISNVSVTHIESSGSFADSIVREKSNFRSDLFIVGNNLATGSESLLTADTAGLVALSEEEGFDTLVVKCPFTTSLGTF